MSPSPLQRKFTLNLLTEWRALGLPFEEDSVVLAVSGGADSCALVLGVADLVSRGKLKGRVVIGHFDHQIRRESGEDAAFVEALAGRLGFEFTLGLPKPGELSRASNLEEKARILRYKFLLRAAEGAGARHVLTAHTVNDQAETLLLNLIRGSGLKGLAGMGRKVPIGTIIPTRYRSGEEGHSKSGIMVCRPMLGWATREMTVSYTADCGVSERIDAMNADLAFQRVRVRKEVIPMLKNLNPNIIETLARTAENLASEAALLRSEPSEFAESVLLSGHEALSVAKLAGMPELLRVYTVRRWLENRTGSLRRIGRAHIVAVADLAVSAKSGRTVELPGELAVEKAKGQLILKNLKVEK